MRWKLIFIAALVASIAGTGLTFALAHALYGSTRRLNTYDPAALGALLIPLIIVTLASTFVYRHTARRRKTQALATAVLALLFTLTIFVIGSIYFSKQTPVPPSSTTPRIVN